MVASYAFNQCSGADSFPSSPDYGGRPHALPQMVRQVLQLPSVAEPAHAQRAQRTALLQLLLPEHFQPPGFLHVRLQRQHHRGGQAQVCCENNVWSDPLNARVALLTLVSHCRPSVRLHVARNID